MVFLNFLSEQQPYVSFVKFKFGNGSRFLPVRHYLVLMKTQAFPMAKTLIFISGVPSCLSLSSPTPTLPKFTPLPYVPNFVSFNKTQ